MDMHCYGHYRILQLLVLSFVLIFLTACDSTIGVEWVTDYSAVGKATVANRDDNARGFYEALSSHPDWVVSFDRGNVAAWEKHFKRGALGGLDAAWVDDVHIAYFSGHGAGEGSIAGSTGVGRGGGFTFGVNAHDDWVLGSIPSMQEPRWGDGILNWIVLDVCSALARKNDGDSVEYTLYERWANSNVMHGLHYILGFRSSAIDSGVRGRLFAEYLNGTRDGTKYNVRTAWRRATEDTEEPGVDGAYLRAFSSGSNTYNEHIFELGPVSRDPDPATQGYGYGSWPCI